MDEKATCELCGEPMPDGETMFKFHGYSGPCPKPPLTKTEREAREEARREAAANAEQADNVDAMIKAAELSDAAPDLLAACQALLPILADAIMRGMPITKEVAHARNIAVAAVAKATKA